MSEQKHTPEPPSKFECAEAEIEAIKAERDQLRAELAEAVGFLRRSTNLWMQGVEYHDTGSLEHGIKNFLNKHQKPEGS